MDAQELQHIDYLAATRLSQIGFYRYKREKNNVMTNQIVKVARQSLHDFIDRTEARELILRRLVTCAPLSAALQ